MEQGREYAREVARKKTIVQAKNVARRKYESIIARNQVICKQKGNNSLGKNVFKKSFKVQSIKVRKKNSKELGKIACKKSTTEIGKKQAEQVAKRRPESME